mgnify:CR=1 FL=1
MTTESFYHLGFSARDLDPVGVDSALLCGDPLRARRIALETEGVTCLRIPSENRGLHSYLC